MRSLPLTFLALVAALAPATALEGCLGILGDFSVGASPDANVPGNPQDEGGSSDAGGNAEAPNGTALDAATTDGQAPGDGSARDTMAPGDGPNPEVGTTVCAPGGTQCSPDGGVQDCVSGQWAAPIPCNNSVCSNGQCSGTCLPNTVQCSGNSVQRCDSTGHLGAPSPCVNQACVGGACQGVCVPGSTLCADAGTETCETDGGWGVPTACGMHQACMGGGTTQATCTCQTTACAASGTICTNSTDLASCTQDVQGCWFASAPTPCTNGACFGSAGSASCCTNQCAQGQTRCGGAGLETCVAQGNGCLAYNAGAACGTHQTCTGTAGSAMCTCQADPTCTSANNVCTGSTLTTCAADSQNCFYAVSSSSCGTNATCTSMNTCACQNGFTSCSSGCVDTTTDNNNCGACGKACPTLTAPNVGATCSAQTCIGKLGGAVEVGTNAVPVDPDGMTVVLVKATTGPQPLTYVGMGALVGSTNASPSTTSIIFALYSDNNGVPGNLILDTSNSVITFNDPSPLQAVQSGGFISDQSGGFSGLTPNTTYWVYMKAGVGGNSGSTAAVSTAQCIQANWINNQPPAQYTNFSGQTACPNAYEVYLVVSYP